ncbi:MAG: DUF3489 domain-containing protein [Terricaulis sp.]
MTSTKPKRRAVSPHTKKDARNALRQPVARQSKARTAPTTKLDALIAALSAPKGATLAQLMALTGWQVHSVRGVMSGTLKKKRGLSIGSSKTGAERVYRIEGRK